METLLRKQRSKYNNPEGSNVAVSGLWFKVSGKIWKIEPIPEQTLKILFTGRSLLGHFISLAFDLIYVILEVALRQDYRERRLFSFCFADSITLFKILIRKKGFPLNLHPNRRNLSIDEPTSLYFFLFQTSFNAHARCTRKCFCTTRNNFYSQIDPWRKQ